MRDPTGVFEMRNVNADPEQLYNIKHLKTARKLIKRIGDDRKNYPINDLVQDDEMIMR